MAQLANALQSNTKLPLECLELGGNYFDDKKGKNFDRIIKY